MTACHPQPLVVSVLPYLFGAALGWCAATADEKLLTSVTNRDVFQDPTGKTALAALALGLAHRKFGFFCPEPYAIWRGYRGPTTGAA